MSETYKEKKFLALKYLKKTLKGDTNLRIDRYVNFTLMVSPASRPKSCASLVSDFLHLPSTFGPLTFKKNEGSSVFPLDRRLPNNHTVSLVPEHSVA